LPQNLEFFGIIELLADVKLHTHLETNGDHTKHGHGECHDDVDGRAARDLFEDHRADQSDGDLELGQDGKEVVATVHVRVEVGEQARGEEANDHAECALLHGARVGEHGDADERDLAKALEDLKEVGLVRVAVSQLLGLDGQRVQQVLSLRVDTAQLFRAQQLHELRTLILLDVKVLDGPSPCLDLGFHAILLDLQALESKESVSLPEERSRVVKGHASWVEDEHHEGKDAPLRVLGALAVDAVVLEQVLKLRVADAVKSVANKELEGSHGRRWVDKEEEKERHAVTDVGDDLALWTRCHELLSVNDAVLILVPSLLVHRCAKLVHDRRDNVEEDAND